MVSAGQAALNWSYTPEQISAAGDKYVNGKKELLDKIAALPLDQATFENVLQPLGQHENDTTGELMVITFFQHTSPDKALRDASTEVEKRLQEFEIECAMREDVYKVVDAVYQRTDRAALAPEDRRLLEKTHLDFRRNGLALPKDKQEQLKALHKRLADLSIQFARNVNEADTEVTFTKDELLGMPDDFLAGRETKEVDGQTQFVVTTKYPDLFPILTLAKREATRQRLQYAYDTRCKENIGLLEEAIRVRQESATLLGYPDHASYVLEEKMAKSPTRVNEFLTELRGKLLPLGHDEIAKFIAYQREVKDALGEPLSGAGTIYSWDYRFYMNQVKEREFEVDDEAVKQYFPMERVTQGMLEIYQTVLGLKFTEVKDANVWQEDVQLYEVWDKASGDFVGHFYLDLFPRKGKYNHAACFPIRAGSRLADGTYTTPVNAMVANFSKPTPNAPSLLKHDEVTTYFHELGHVMHGLCSQTKWARFHGTNTENDFVEAPSQMLENWCWEPEVLKGLSGHYETGKPIPEELLNRLVKSKNVCAGLSNLRQLFFGLFDLKVHSKPADGSDQKVDVIALWRSMRQDVTLIKDGQDDKETWPAAGFGHIMGGYDAGYYGYMWSQVFSADMFYSRFKVEGVMNPKTGHDYRYEILKPGGSRDGMEHLKAFLGREPKIDPFLKSLGLN
ncbi:metalloendopeptidase [Tieghemiomyces parasiticus]|uniref:Metalloendopeptidase n=1 Tax=Tieghemiomyces parasiticus TaxID=78921 RepID=A0A9W8DV50_9FUNG|nr:metalloendopeptidase [Tieghemiomyces parasiticus]